MTAFKVKTDSLYRSGEGLEQAAARLVSVSRRLSSVSSAWVLQNNAFAGVRCGLRRSGESAALLGGCTANMQGTLREIAHVYERMEREALTGCAEAEGDIPYELPGGMPQFGDFPNIGPGGVPNSDGKGDNSPVWWDYVKQLLSGLGIFGMAISAGGNFAMQDWAESFKDVTKLVGEFGDMVDHAGSTNISWRNVLKGYSDPGVSRNVFKNLKNEVGKYGFPKGGSVGQKVSAGAAWVGAIIELGENAVENYNEHGGITDRMLRETLTETGLVLGLECGLIAVAGALLPVGTAALAVGAVAAVAGIAVNWALDSICGGDWVEAASDAINNGLEAAAGWFDGLRNQTDAVVEWAGDKLDKASKWVGEKIGNAVYAAKDRVGCAWKGVIGQFAH